MHGRILSVAAEEQKSQTRQMFRPHNMKEYDGYFILQYLYDNNNKPKVILNRAKIMSITVPESGIVFKGTLNFFPMALSKLPKSFSIEELCKGYFPYLKNTKDNADYKGELLQTKYLYFYQHPLPDRTKMPSKGM